MAAAAAPPPLTDALDPTQRYSLVSLALADLPAEIIASPILRRLKLVKTLSGEHGLVTEVQQFQESSVAAIRSIDGAIQEFNLPKDEAAVLHALQSTAAFDIASRRLALMQIFRDHPVFRPLLEDCAALRFDHATQKAIEPLTRKYTQALFANVFTDGLEGIRTIGDLVSRLDQLSVHADPVERQRARAHVLNLQQRFRLNDVSDILPFFSDFELLVTAISHYRRCFLDLAPHMRRLEADVHTLSQPDNQLISAMLAMVSRHLSETVASIERFFQAFDASFDAIISTAEPNIFKELQENLQRAYATIGARLCGWGLRVQAMHAFMQQQRRPPSAQARIDIVRQVVCKHLNEGDLDPEDLKDAVAFLRRARHG
jgi:hypothetical protein